MFKIQNLQEVEDSAKLLGIEVNSTEKQIWRAYWAKNLIVCNRRDAGEISVRELYQQIDMLRDAKDTLRFWDGSSFSEKAEVSLRYALSDAWRHEKGLVIGAAVWASAVIGIVGGSIKYPEAMARTVENHPTVFAPFKITGEVENCFGAIKFGPSGGKSVADIQAKSCEDIGVSSVVRHIMKLGGSN